MGERHQFHAFRQFQMGKMHRLVQLHLRQIHLDEFRQVLREAGYFQIVYQVRHHAARLLDAGRGIGAGEVQRHAHAQLLGGAHALQVEVHDARLVRMALQGAQHGLFFLAVQFDGEDVRIKRLVLQMLEQRIMLHRYRHGGLFAAVDDARNLVRVPQAAARTFAPGVARFRNQCEINSHGYLQLI